MKKNTAIYFMILSVIGVITAVAITLITMSPAMAATDWTIVGPLKAHESVTRSVELETGKSTIEIWSAAEGTKVSCRLNTGSFTIESVNTSRCVFPIEVSITSSMRVQVTNESDRQVDYRIWVHDTK